MASVHESTVTVDALREHARGGRLHVVLDSCDLPDVFARVLRIGVERAPCLLSGQKAAEFCSFAPYLTACDEPLLDWVSEELTGEPWGIFVVTAADLRTLRLHLKTLLVVRDPNGRQMYFRFYDPRVLASFLPTCTPAEARQVFGPVEAFGVADVASGTVTLIGESADALASPRRTMVAQRPLGGVPRARGG
jgi:hypothetical protein